MKPYYSTENGVLYNCDCLDVLKQLPNNSIDFMLTDPPAGISFMGKSWDKDKGGRNEHPTVKPLKLLKYLLTLLKTPTGGTCLDCFAGSGSTMVACENMGLKYIGIEREKDYCEIAKQRIENERKQMKLF